MTTKRATLKQWFRDLEDPVPVEYVGRLLDMPQDQVVHEIRTKRLPVHRFKADTGQTWRVVKMSDLLLYRVNPLDRKKLMRAAAMIVTRWANQAA